jgi:hypothetical protein
VKAEEIVGVRDIERRFRTFDILQASLANIDERGVKEDTTRS